MYEEIASNKRKSVLLVIGAFLFLGVIGLAIGYLFGTGPLGLVIALVVAFLLATWSYFSGDKVVLVLDVRAPGIRDPRGSAIVTDRGVRVGRITVTDGHGRLVLRNVSSGLHRYRFAYTGMLQTPRNAALDVTIR